MADTEGEKDGWMERMREEGGRGKGQEEGRRKKEGGREGGREGRGKEKRGGMEEGKEGGRERGEGNKGVCERDVR